MAYAYTTPEKVKQELQVSVPFSSNTKPNLSTVHDWIEEESAYINTIAARVFGSTFVEDEYVDLSGDDDILLPVAPIISIDTLEYNKLRLGSPEGEDWEVKLEDVHFITYPDVGRIHILRSNWNPHNGRRRVKISYSYGYENTPLVIQLLASKLVAKRVIDATLFGKLESGNTGSVSIGAVSVVESGNLSVPAYRKLDEDIDMLKRRVIDEFKVFRPIAL